MTDKPVLPIHYPTDQSEPRFDEYVSLPNEEKRRITHDRQLRACRKLVSDDELERITWSPAGIDLARKRMASLKLKTRHRQILFDRIAYMYPGQSPNIIMYACGWPLQRVNSERAVAKAVDACLEDLGRAFPENLKKVNTMRKALAQKGINMQMLAKTMWDGLHATKPVSRYRNGKWVTEESPDHTERRLTVDQIAKLADLGPDKEDLGRVEKVEINVTQTNIYKDGRPDPHHVVETEARPADG